MDQSQFKVQDIPSHLKEQFEGYFLETTIPPPPPSTLANNTTATTANNNNIPSTVTPQQPPPPQQQQQQVVILPPQDPGAPVAQNVQPQHLAPAHTVVAAAAANPSEVFDIADVARKLSHQFEILKDLLKKSGTGCAAVKQFTDRFDRIYKPNQLDQLESALCNFGPYNNNNNDNQHSATWNELFPPDKPPTITTPVGTLSVTQKKITTTPIAAVPQAAIVQNAVAAVTTPPTATKKKTPKRSKAEINQVPPGSIDPVTGKRRKRSRCGTCLGCINRDKTQDCRECRNCLDQKRYGGPGRLKKACVKRSCIVMSTPEGSTAAATLLQHQQQQQQQQITLPTTTISLPLHPVPVTATASVASSTTRAPVIGVTTMANTQQQPQQQAPTVVNVAGGGGPPPAVLSYTQFTPTFQVCFN